MTHREAWEALLVDGVDVINPETVHLTWGGVLSVAGLSGGNYELPGRSGVGWAEKTRAAGEIELDLLLEPVDATRLTFEQRVEVLTAQWERLATMLAGPRLRPLNLTRIRPLPGGKFRRHSAVAELSGALRPDMDPEGFELAVRVPLRLLDGVWFDDDTARHVILPGASTTVPVLGTTDTDNMTIFLTNEGAGQVVQTLTNVTTGAYLVFRWDNPPADTPATTTEFLASTIEVRPREFRAFGPLYGSPNINWLVRLTHGGAKQFMLLDPTLNGRDNVFTLSSGRAVIEYRGAYL